MAEKSVKKQHVELLLARTLHMSLDRVPTFYLGEQEQLLVSSSKQDKLKLNGPSFSILSAYSTSETSSSFSASIIPHLIPRGVYQEQDQDQDQEQKQEKELEQNRSRRRTLAIKGYLGLDEKNELRVLNSQKLHGGLENGHFSLVECTKN